MKKVFVLLIAAVFVTMFTPSAKAQIGKIWDVGGSTDTAKPNTTKTQTVSTNHAGGTTIQYRLDQITDTVTGYVSVWCSLDGVTYFPHPTADSVAIAAATDVYKVWFINTRVNGNPVKFLRLITRCPSNTTNSTGKAHIRAKMFPY